jgi:hypothetical protein
MKKIKIPDQRKGQSSFKGRDMTLEAGICKKEEPCSRIIWDEAKVQN